MRSSATESEHLTARGEREKLTMFRIRKIGNKWEIYKQMPYYNTKAYIWDGIFPGLDTPLFDSKKLAKKWLKANVGMLI